MHNYHTQLIWAIDAALLAASAMLAAVIILGAVIGEYLWKRRTRALLNIKENVYEMILAGQKAAKAEFSTFMALTSPQQFLDVTTNRNRELIFFNDSEQQMFKKYFVSPKNIGRLEKLAVRSRNKWQRIEAILALGHGGSSGAVGIMKKTLFSKDEDIAYFSMSALGQLKTMEAAEPLIELFGKSPLWRYKLVSILESFPEEVADEAVKLTYGKDPSLRIWAVKLASKFKAGHRADRILELMSDGSPEVRAAACEYLGRSGAKKAEGALIKALKDDSWLVRSS